MSLHNPHLARCIQTLAALPNLTSITPGPECPQCGARFVITYGRRSKAWLVLHPGIGPAALCPGYAEKHAPCATQEDAIRAAQEASV